MTVKYDHNNSGGRWWLSDKDWKALEAAGWTVNWYATRPMPFGGAYEGGRFLGALASSAQVTVEHDDARQVIEQWEDLTGQNANDLGCYSCCGPPHSFNVEFDDGREIWLSPEPTGSSLTGW